jgi:hypothetical protein
LEARSRGTGSMAADEEEGPAELRAAGVEEEEERREEGRGVWKPAEDLAMAASRIGRAGRRSLHSEVGEFIHPSI